MDLYEIFENIDTIPSRLLVIECSTLVEQGLSRTLGHLLNIEPENSVSFGFSSVSLGIHLKINLIKDMRGLPKELSSKLETFIQTRNKFAHLNHVDSFKNFFELPNCRSIRGRLNKWYEDEADNSENIYKRQFWVLTFDIVLNLVGIIATHFIKIEKEKDRIKMDAKKLQLLTAELENFQGGKELLERISNQLKEPGIHQIFDQLLQAFKNSSTKT